MRLEVDVGVLTDAADKLAAMLAAGADAYQGVEGEAASRGRHRRGFEVNIKRLYEEDEETLFPPGVPEWPGWE